VHQIGKVGKGAVLLDQNVDIAHPFRNCNHLLGVEILEVANLRLGSRPFVEVRLVLVAFVVLGDGFVHVLVRTGVSHPDPFVRPTRISADFTIVALMPFDDPVSGSGSCCVWCKPFQIPWGTLLWSVEIRPGNASVIRQAIHPFVDGPQFICIQTYAAHEMSPGCDWPTSGAEVPSI
jgi:hypothetical protein